MESLILSRHDFFQSQRKGLLLVFWKLPTMDCTGHLKMKSTSFSSKKMDGPLVVFRHIMTKLIPSPSNVSSP